MRIQPTRLVSISLLLLMTAAFGGIGAQEFIVSSRFSNQVLRYDVDGTHLGVFAAGGGMRDPDGIAFGPDGHLYVVDGHTPTVRRYHGRSGRFIDRFVRDNPRTSGDESGGLENPRGITFGPDDNLYVCSGTGDQVLRYEGETGTFIDVFAEAAQLGPVSIAFGPDGDLYVTTALAVTDQVKVFDGRSGALLRVLSNADLPGPTGLAFDIRGDLYVSSGAGNRVVRFDTVTGNARGFLWTILLFRAL